MPDEPRFTLEQEFDRESLLAEAVEAIRFRGVELSRTSKVVPEVAESKCQALDFVEKLGIEQASFSPALPCKAISAQDFSGRQVPLPQAIGDDFRVFDFFWVRVPVTLIPRSGWAFTRLECRIDFIASDGTHFFVHDVFPEDKWATLLKAETHLNLGVDEGLKFQAQVGTAAGGARVGVNVDAGARFVLGPFAYEARRPLVRAWGRDNIFAFWRIDGRADAGEEEVGLGVILRVRKSRNGPVAAVGRLKAYHDFHLLGATLRDFIESFTPAVKSFFVGGAVLSATQRWNDITE